MHPSDHAAQSQETPGPKESMITARLKSHRTHESPSSPHPNLDDYDFLHFFLLGINLHRWHPQTIVISPKLHMFTQPLGFSNWLDPLTPSGDLPHIHHETSWSRSNITVVVFTHDFLDCLRCFLGVVEGNRGNGMMKDVSLANFMEEIVPNPTEGPIHSCCSSTLIVPDFWVISR